ncbi:MAG TPA: hypothetical protein VGJ92_05795, partial [Methanocella sp.]
RVFSDGLYDFFCPEKSYVLLQVSSARESRRSAPMGGRAGLFLWSAEGGMRRVPARILDCSCPVINMILTGAFVFQVW